jgi:hypothetical protein
MGFFGKKYKLKYPNEPTSITREMYGRRKWVILRSMTKSELLHDFQHDEFFGNKLNSKLTKIEILKILKLNSGLI